MYQPTALVGSSVCQRSKKEAFPVWQLRMPDRAQVVTYAAGASLAAITLIYVFGPTYFLDSDPSKSSGGTFSSRKTGVVGLANPANDCFINSVLQALAGLGDLRLYLIREVHRRSLDDSVYAQPVPPGALLGDEAKADLVRFGKDMPDWKLEGLQTGTVTKSLKEILDALNERPIYKKTISAAPFVGALETAFRQRVSRQQQDAQEFLQVVAERLCDEYHAGRRARYFARQVATLANGRHPNNPTIVENGDESSASPAAASPTTPPPQGEAAGKPPSGGTENEQEPEEEDGFPLEGRFESQIECLTCRFKPRPTESTFCTLTLNVPQAQATTLGACFDGMFKTEYIDDFKCEKCRLLHAIELFESEAQRSTSDAPKARAQAAVEALRLALADPEKPPANVALPDIRHAPKRRIARHIRLTVFPKILAIHLSRSIFDASRTSMKNSAKVAFPEQLPLGGLLQQRKYKLLGVVTHKGSHNSGHYESFRRQNLYPPFSNPSTFQPSGAYSKAASPASTPRIKALREHPGGPNTLAPTRYSLVSGFGANSSRASLDSVATPPGSSGAIPARDDRNSTSSTRPSTTHCPDEKPTDRADDPTSAAASSPRSTLSRSPSRPSSQLGETRFAGSLALPAQTTAPSSKPKQQHKAQSRWWRISDEKVKEATTRDVLSMQREVYLLFYELERPS